MDKDDRKHIIWCVVSVAVVIAIPCIVIAIFCPFGTPQLSGDIISTGSGIGVVQEKLPNYTITLQDANGHRLNVVVPGGVYSQLSLGSWVEVRDWKYVRVVRQ